MAGKATLSRPSRPSALSRSVTPRRCSATSEANRPRRRASITFGRPVCWSGSGWRDGTRTSSCSRTEADTCSKRIGVSGRASRVTFYAGLKTPRELTHDAQVYRACRDAEAQVRDQGGHVRRVVLDYELKREYQHFLQERNWGRADSTGRPDRTPDEIAAWVKDHDLPCDGNRVHFPDARIEYEDRDRQQQHRDIEVVTPHYRGAHAAAVARSGFQSYGGALRLQTSGRRGGRGIDPRLAEEIQG
jgi:hypothetical protein